MPNAKSGPSAPRTRSPKSPEWNVTTVCEVKKAQEVYRKLKDAGTKERRVVVLGPSAFAVVWR